MAPITSSTRHYPGKNPEWIQFIGSDDPHYSGSLILQSNTFVNDNGQLNYIEPPMILGKVTATGKLRKLMRTALNGAVEDTPTLVLVDASPFIVGDSIKVAGGSSTVIESINYATNTVVVEDNQTADDESAVLGINGAEEPFGFLLGEEHSTFSGVKLYDEENLNVVERNVNVRFSRCNIKQSFFPNIDAYTLAFFKAKYVMFI